MKRLAIVLAALLAFVGIACGGGDGAKPASSTRAAAKPLSLREGIDARMKSSSVLVVERSSENGEPQVLECTRSVPWVNGAPSWSEDLKQSKVASKWGPINDSAVAPPLRPEELRGADCGRATHWVKKVGANGTDIEYGRIRHKPASVPSIFPKVTPYPVAACPLGTPGNPNVSFGMAQRLYNEGKFMDAFAIFQQLANGFMGDEKPYREDAEYLSAVSLGELGMFTEASGLMETMAKAPCHYRHAEAAYWLTIRDRRANF